MRKAVKFLILFLLIASRVLYAQNDSLVKATINAATDSIRISVDSSNQLILSTYKLKAEKQRLKDSIKVAQLEFQISELSVTGELRKEQLQAQLNQIFHKNTRKLEIDSIRAHATPHPVYGFFKDTLFSIYSNIGHFKAKDRAQIVTNRIKNLQAIYGFKTDTLKIAHTQFTTDVMLGETLIASISDDDAIWENTTRNELANTYLEIIANAVTHYQKETSSEKLSSEIGEAILVVLVAILLIFISMKFFSWTKQKIISKKGSALKGIKIRNYTLFDAQREVDVLLLINKGLKWFSIIMLMYIVLPILFGIFPWTRDLADTLFGFLLNPAKEIMLSLWSYLPNLISLIILITIFRYVLKLFNYLKEEIRTERLKIPGFYPEWANPTYAILKVLSYAFLLVVIFPYIPFSDSPIFKGVSVFLGVIFSFSSSGSLSNLIAGILMTYMRLFKIGDRIQIGDITGDLIEKSTLAIRVKTIKNVVISIPNTTVLNSHIVNYSSELIDQQLILHTSVAIGYDTPWHEVSKALIHAAQQTELVLDEPAPFVLKTSLDPFSISYQINVYTKNSNQQAIIYSNLHANILDSLNNAGIEILTPVYRASRDGSKTTIPEDHLKKE